MSASSFPEMVSLVYWWDGGAKRWQEVSWDLWMASSGVSAAAKPLPGIRPGDTHFVVCVVDDDGSIANIIPHRYLIDEQGYRHHGDEPVTDEENEFERAYCLKRETTEAEDRRHVEINEKVYRWSLPSAGDARALLRMLPAPPSVNAKHGIRHFLSACGASLHSTRLQ
jgi:hypothetical protein